MVRRRGVDTNVLIAAHVPSHADHAAVLRFLLAELANEETMLVLTASVLAEFVHVATDGRRHPSPATMTDAISAAETYLGRENVALVDVDREAVAYGFQLLREHRLGRKRIADTVLAASLLHHDVGELITCDTHDFAVFADLTTIDPRVS